MGRTNELSMIEAETLNTLDLVLFVPTFQLMLKQEK